ncbi:MAG: ABC transporter permease [Nitrososphaeria archaeon]
MNALKTLQIVFFIIIGLLISSLLFIPFGLSPWRGLETLLLEGFLSSYGIIETLKLATPLMIIAIGLSIPFTAKVWNIGGQGQFIMGEIFSVWVGLLLINRLPPAVVLPIAFAFAFIGGALWALPPILMKVTAGTNEIITTLMMNFVAVYLLDYLLIGPMEGSAAKLVHAPASNPIPPSYSLLRILPGTQLSAELLIGLALAGLMYYILNYINLGYELKLIGSGEKVARFAGVSPNLRLIEAMVVSGGISGIAGMVYVYGTTYILIPQFFSDISTSFGYVGIPVALVASLNPLAIIFSSVFLAGILNGAYIMEALYSIPIDVAITVYGIIMLFSMIGVMTNVLERLIKVIRR